MKTIETHVGSGVLSVACVILLVSACEGARDIEDYKVNLSDSASKDMGISTRTGGMIVTPLMVAIGARDEAKVRDLLAGGASPDDPLASRSPLILAITSFDSTPSASLICNKAIVRALLDRGADPNRVDPSVGSLPLHAALDVGDAECARLIHDAGGRTDLRDRNGRTLATAATGAMKRTGRSDILDLVIGWGIDVNERAEDGGTALHEAVRVNSEEAASALIERGIDPCIRNAINQTALDMAINLGRPSGLVNLLRGATRCASVDVQK